MLLHAALVALAPGPAAAPCPRGAVPAYAHNDYANARPLADALALGYRGAEADVVLVGGSLRLGHDRRAARRGAAFEATYLRPLAALAARCGTLTADGAPFLLNVELKERSPAAYDTLAALAGRYASLLAPAAPGAPPPVELVLVGWSPAAPRVGTPPLWHQARLRRPGDARAAATAPGVRLVSVDYGKTIGRWWVGAAARRRWLAALRAVKASAGDRRLRVHNVPVDARVYAELRAAGVDLIGTKALVATARLLAPDAARVGP